MAKRTLSVSQKKALARGRAKLKAMRRRGETPKRKKARKPNPLKSGYSARTVSENVAKLVREGRPTNQASAAALRSARASYRAKHPRGAFPAHLALTRTTRRRNPDPALMRTRTLASDTKAGKKRLTNPPHYVIRQKNKTMYFDGAGWTGSKKWAAQYMTKSKAANIGEKVANATNKPVYVVPV